MIKEINKIIAKYTAGKVSLEDTNAALREIGSVLQLDPNNNKIELSEVGRYGLLDTGTGTYNKVEVKAGKLVDTNCGEMPALCIFDGHIYTVKSDVLIY